MGCDIHAFIEYVYDGDTHTNTFCGEEIHFGRDYGLFSLLAGVRGVPRPLVNPRGFPDDCIAAGDTTIFPSSWEVKEKYIEYGDSAHSATWLTLDELKKIRAEYIKENLEFNGISDKEIWALANNVNAANSIFTYTFGENESSGLYLTIVIMESLLKLDPKLKIRFVCWFDS
jgi:hypothetical protein